MTQSSDSKEHANGKEPLEDSNVEASDSAPSATTDDIPAFGWSAYAERVNGRFAMLGLVSVLLIEVLSGQAFLHWAGFLR